MYFLIVIYFTTSSSSLYFWFFFSMISFPDVLFTQCNIYESINTPSKPCIMCMAITSGLTTQCIPVMFVMFPQRRSKRFAFFRCPGYIYEAKGTYMWLG